MFVARAERRHQVAEQQTTLDAVNARRWSAQIGQTEAAATML